MQIQFLRTYEYSHLLGTCHTQGTLIRKAEALPSRRKSHRLTQGSRCLEVGPPCPA